MARPLMSAVAAQQKLLEKLAHENEVLRLQLAYVARLAGITEHLSAIRREADADNPAQPVPNPASQSATESTEETVTPKAYDNANKPGLTPGANDGVPAMSTATPMDVGTSVPTQPYNNLVDVTAPISGTETHVPNEQTRIETDVRVGDPMNPETAFPLNPAWAKEPNLQSPAGPPKDGEMSQTKGASRTMAAFRLAKLQIEAGLARGGDEFAVVAAIEGNQHYTLDRIQHEIIVLESVKKSASTRQRPANLVPRAASQQPKVSLQSTASASRNDDDDSDLFL